MSYQLWLEVCAACCHGRAWKHAPSRCSFVSCSLGNSTSNVIISEPLILLLSKFGRPSPFFHSLAPGFVILSRAMWTYRQKKFQDITSALCVPQYINALSNPLESFNWVFAKVSDMQWVQAVLLSELTSLKTAAAVTATNRAPRCALLVQPVMTPWKFVWKALAKGMLYTSSSRTPPEQANPPHRRPAVKLF